ncbi:endopeptidase, partial [Lactobacillus paragasseri]
ITFDKSGNYVVNKITAQGTLEVGDDIQGIIVKNDGVGTVSYAGPGKVPLYTSPFGGHKSGQYLSNGQSYKIYWKAKDIDGTFCYNLGNRDTQWISSKYFVLSKTGDYATQKA